MKGVLVVGNPKAGGRTTDAGGRLLAGFAPDETVVLELSELGAGLLGWGDPGVKAAVQTVQSADVVVFASPTFKASYTGLLKLFLDQFAGGTGLAGVVAVPVLLSAAAGHALAGEYQLKPVLSEIGATVPTPALSLIDSTYTEDGVLEAFVERWAPVVAKLT